VSGGRGGGGDPGGRGVPPQLDAFQVDVRDLMGRTVANLYSHLITRPTGRAVRLAIESQLEELERPALSLVDFSSVAILDYSCADEVVAKLLLALRDGGDAGRAWVLFRGIGEGHRDPVEAVLERHGLQAVLETPGGSGELLGPVEDPDRRLWDRIETAGWTPAAEVDARLIASEEDEGRLGRLVRHRLVYRHPLRGDVLALSTLSRELNPGGASP
jgi:hypothetical protein